MVSVCGLEITSERMSKIAKNLLYAHCCIVLMTVLGGLLSIIANVVMNAAISDLEEETGDTAEDGAGNIALNYSVDIFGRLVIPCVMLFLARFAIQSNNQGLMQCICFTDGIGTCLECCGTVASIAMVIVMIALKKWAEDEDCNEYWYHEDDDWTKQDCLDTRDTAISIFGTAMIIYIIVALLTFCAMSICFWATMQANQGQFALSQGEVFVGYPVQTNQIPTGQVVVGQPVSQPVVQPQGEKAV
mmetsp:Transcript_72864/g.152143  ORF Transcript_72864/g.152143 Transcript_72864/m.152143 type:complete len:245 (+) Transcript_72864:235-969(+)|eukprot:CAMPEP_0206459662 /NCGR_PEP_ID=MMETSP0324_2-20121206/24306_1 /ASSEMBLY_ACC=CAM_ASM_000836 /TAXON_ID=2866 /ORGANISM="Crypthecodinium cohnii, Strain Seligo" /LENGTH=244 /DNA_ID=CAMNT_0053931249 /DNA_START=187 /DNA_END=921 /DNA_ORIENTATION=-